LLFFSCFLFWSLGAGASVFYLDWGLAGYKEKKGTEKGVSGFGMGKIDGDRIMERNRTK